MKNIEIYVHTDRGVDLMLVTTSQDATVEQLIDAILAATGLKSKADEKLHLFLEDGDEPLEHHHKVGECEIRHRHHVHCHRCQRVKVSVFYNREISAVFAPSTKIGRVLKWTVKELKLTPAEAADKILTLKGSDEELPLDAHIGSYAKPHDCSINLCLTAPVEVNG